MITLYAVIRADGTLKYRDSNHGRGPMVFDDEAKAKGNARSDGDSVVRVDVDLSREPLFIRRKLVSDGVTK